MLTVSINRLKLLTQCVNRLSTHYVNRYQNVNSCVNNSVNTSETMLAKCAALSTLPLGVSRLLGHGTEATHDVLAVYDDAILWCVCVCVCVGMCVCVAYLVFAQGPHSAVVLFHERVPITVENLVELRVSTQAQVVGRLLHTSLTSRTTLPLFLQSDKLPT
jgi:hypothetical protein